MIEAHDLTRTRKWAESVHTSPGWEQVAGTVLQLLDHYENGTIRIKLDGTIHGTGEAIGTAIGELIKQLTPESAAEFGRSFGAWRSQSLSEQIEQAAIARNPALSPDESP